MKFNKKLLLNSYLLSLFGVSSFEELASYLEASRLEELNKNDNSLFYHELKDKLITTNKIISDNELLEYDENIVRHTKAMGRNIKWKYFQYLSLLFIEIYLDKYFDDKEQLLEDLNIHLKEFNTKMDNNKEKLPEYAEIFSKDSKGLFESNAIEIIEITKLGDENGDKTVAVDSFEDNNLVFIDEGHRGAKGEIWKTNIVSNTSFNDILDLHNNISKSELEDKNVLFQIDDSYVAKMFEKILK